MAEPDRPQSPFAGMADLSVRTPVRVLSPDEAERMLAGQRLYLETEYHQASARIFIGTSGRARFLRAQSAARVKMDLYCDKGVPE
jgi:hypothetical protein